MNDHEPRQARILLVEDEALIALSEKRTLENHGYEVITAYNGEKAVATATQDTAINLVLMDIDLGSGIDGTEAAEQILKARRVPIVFLTSHAEKEYVDRVKRITNYGYVLKGSGEFVLNESINMALQLFEAHQETADKQERLSFVINEAPVGIFQSSSNGTLKHLNSEMAHILGFDSTEEALHYYTDVGQQIYVFQQRRNELLNLIEEQGVVRDFRVEIVRITGEKAYLKVNAHRVPSSGEGGMLINAFVVDETERQEAEQELDESREQYQSVVDLAQEIIVRHDIEGKWTFVNEAACRFFGKSRDELIGQHYMDYLHPEDREDARAARRTMADHGDDIERLMNRQWTPGGYRTVEWNSSPFTDKQSRFLGHQAIGRPITEDRQLQEQAEHKLHEEAKKLEGIYSRLQTVIDNVPFLINEIDVDGHYVLVNEATCKVVGLSKDQVMGKHFKEVLPQETAATFQHRIEQVYATGEQLTVDDRLNLGGEPQVFRTVLTPLHRDENTIQSVVGIAYDVSRQIEALQQKDLLMRELNHRVKNNLNLVSSLVDLKDSTLGTEVDLSDIRNQITAIAKVHEALQDSDDITHIDLRNHVADVLSSVFQSSSGRPITIESDLPNNIVRTEVALPLGLIINEAATNALKHGFTGHEERRFMVALKEDSSGQNYILTISNTGRPFPEDVNIENPHGLGLQLVSALVSQLQGTLELQRKPQPEFTIRFPVSRIEG